MGTQSGGAAVGGITKMTNHFIAAYRSEFSNLAAGLKSGNSDKLEAIYERLVNSADVKLSASLFASSTAARDELRTTVQASMSGHIANLAVTAFLFAEGVAMAWSGGTTLVIAIGCLLLLFAAYRLLVVHSDFLISVLEFVKEKIGAFSTTS